MSEQNKETAKETIVIKTLKRTSFLASFTVIMLLIYHFIYAHTHYLKNAFYGYANFEDFLYRFPYDAQNSLLITIFGNLRVFFMADLFFIIAGIIFVLSIESGLLLNKLIKPYLENKN